MSEGRLPVVVLVSGRGSNLQAILDDAAAGRLPVTVRAVVSNRPEAYALERARAAGVTAAVVPAEGFADRGAYERALTETVAGHGAELVLLAGFMRILGPELLERYSGRILNIHPSLLPAFRGLRTHERALAAGVREHGATVHFVTAELDAGPSVVQARVPIHPDDDPRTLAARVLAQEHRIYPLAVRWYAEGRLEMRDGRAWLDGRPLHEPVTVTADDDLDAL